MNGFCPLPLPRLPNCLELQAQEDSDSIIRPLPPHQTGNELFSKRLFDWKIYGKKGPSRTHRELWPPERALWVLRVPHPRLIEAHIGQSYAGSSDHTIHMPAELSNE